MGRTSVNGRPRRARKFTWQELSKLNEAHNAHVAVRGKVYDVSGFISKHPGGANQLLLGAGRDVTTLFESYHHFNNYKVLEKYYVGELINNEMATFPEPGEFHREVRKRVWKYFRDNDIDPKFCPWLFFRCILFFLLTNISWIATVYFHHSVLASAFLSVGWGLSLSMMMLSLTHDLSHFAVTHKPWVWTVLGAVNDCITGCSVLVWTYQHVVGHHCYTNIYQMDPDVFTETETPDIRRLFKSQKRLPFYAYQHIYLPFLYCLVGMKKRIQDFSVIFSHKNLSVRVNPLTWSQLAIFLLGKCFFISYHILLPSLFMPWTQVLLLLLLGDFVCWFWLVLVTQVTHVSAHVKWPKPDENNCVQADWAELQVASSQDYATDSWFWNWASGALNNQIAHHLFPATLQSHYPKITPIIRETCEDFGICFRHVSSMREALALHLRFLQQRGQEQEEGARGEGRWRRRSEEKEEEGARGGR